MKEPKERPPTHTPEQIRSISERVYRIRLAEDDGGLDPAHKLGAADRMIAKDNAKGLNGPKLFSNRAGQYDSLTRAYLEVLGIKPESE